MTSVQAERSSARLPDELNNLSPMPNASHKASAPTLLPEIVERLGGRYAAEIEDILRNIAEGKPAPKRIQKQETLCEHQQFALIRLRAKNVEGAEDYIKRHAPHLQDWLQRQMKRFGLRRPLQKSTRSILSQVSVVPDGILIDAELGRIAKILGQFAVFRAWAFAHSLDDGSGRVERKPLEKLWLDVGVATSKRHARRLLRQGCELGYWTQDKATKRIYLTGQVKLAARLIESALHAGYHHLIETNKPGKRRVQVNLSGSLQEATARLYAAWLVAKDPERKGTTISRETLCQLWQVSVPTLITWEDIAGIGKQTNFAQSNDTSLDNVPEHAYLTLNRDGTHAAAWRLPNTYFVDDRRIQQHNRTGKATQIRQTVRREIALAEQRGSIGDAALPRSGRLYFTEDGSENIDAFKACDRYLRRLSRKGGDVFQRRYFFIGSRHGVRIYEPYNIQTNTRETHLAQRLIWQEQGESFIAAQAVFRRDVRDHHDYLAALT